MSKKTSCVSSETFSLLLAYHQRPTVQLRNRLVRMNMGLVRKVAHRLARQCSIPYEDLEQCGYLGLIAAIERFDPTQGCAFSSFAVPYIRGEILHFLRDRATPVKIPRRWQQLNQEGQKIRQALTASLGHQPSEQNIAQHLNLSVEEWRAVRLAMLNRAPLSLSATTHYGHQSSNETSMTLGDMLVDPQEQTRQRIEEDRLELQQALNQLEDKTRQMIEGVFLNQLTRQEVAHQIGVSPITVSRHIQKGIDQLVGLLQRSKVAAEV
jgi:RNA polymerase sigma-B factor